MALVSPLLGLCLATLLVAENSYTMASVFLLAMTLAVPLANRQVLRSLFAAFSKRPYLTLSDAGLHVDGCLLDSLYFAWSDIEAMSPEPKSIEDALKSGNLVAITLRVRSGSRRRWTFSSIQHAVHRGYFEVSGYFSTPPDAVAHAVAECLASKVRRHEPLLLSDMPA